MNKPKKAPPMTQAISALKNFAKKYDDKTVEITIPFVDRYISIAEFYLCFFHICILPVNYSTLATFTPFANAWYGSGKTKLGRMISSSEYLKTNLKSIVSEMCRVAFSKENVFSNSFSNIVDTFDLWMKNEHTTLGRFFPNDDFKYSIGYSDSKQVFVECDFATITKSKREPKYKNRTNGKIKNYSIEKEKNFPLIWWYTKKVIRKWLSLIIEIMESNTQQSFSTKNTQTTYSFEYHFFDSAVTADRELNRLTDRTKKLEKNIWPNNKITKLLFYVLDECQRYEKPTAREIWKLLCSELWRNSDTFPMFYFCGVFGAQFFSASKDSTKSSSPSRRILMPLEALSPENIADLLLKLISTHSMFSFVAKALQQKEQIKKLLEKSCDWKKDSKIISPLILISKLIHILTGGIARWTVMLLKGLENFLFSIEGIENCTDIFDTENSYNAFEKRILSEEALQSISDSIIDQSVDGMAKFSPISVCVLLYHHYFGEFPKKFRTWNPLAKQDDDEFVATSLDLITPKVDLYFQQNPETYPTDNPRFKIVRALLLEKVYKMTFFNTHPILSHFFGSFDPTIDLTSGIRQFDDGKLLEYCLETILQKKLKGPKNQQFSDLFPFLKGTMIASEPANHDFSYFFLPQVKKNGRDFKVSAEVKKMSLEVLQKAMDPQILPTIKRNPAKEVVEILMNISKKAKNTILVFMKPKSGSCDLLVIHNGFLIEFQAKNYKEYKRGQFGEEIEKSFIDQTRKGLLIYVVAGYEQFVKKTMGERQDIYFLKEGSVYDRIYSGTPYFAQENGSLYYSGNKVKIKEVLKRKGKGSKSSPDYKICKNFSDSTKNNPLFEVPKGMELMFLCPNSFDSLMGNVKIKSKGGFEAIVKSTREFLADIKGNDTHDLLIEESFIELYEQNSKFLLQKYFPNAIKEAKLEAEMELKSSKTRKFGESSELGPEKKKRKIEEEGKSNQRQEISKMKHLTLCLWLNKCGIEKGIIEKLSKQTEFDGENLLEAYDQFVAGTDVEFLIQLMGISLEEFGKISNQLKEKLGE